jgi:peptide deformylase
MIKLIPENDPILREKCEPWDFDKDGSPDDLVKEMTKLMFLRKGIGLAAPQCGIQKRLFIMGNPDKLVVCINPEVVSTEQETEQYLEGCLSFPDLWLYIKRPKEIYVKYYNLAGEKVEQTLNGIMARVFLHELDHLDGICFDTRVGTLGLKRAKEKRKKLKS